MRRIKTFIGRQAKHYAAWFGLCVFLAGMGYLLLIMPWSPPDEYYHITQSERVSNALLFHNERLTKIPADARTEGYEFLRHCNLRSGYEALRQALFRPRMPGELRGEALPPFGSPGIPGERIAYVVYPLQFLPQAAGISLGRLTARNNLQVFYLGRLFNLLFYALCCMFSIKLIPRRYRYILALLALMPMSLHQAGSLSYDAFVIGMSFLLASYILHLAQAPGQIETRELVSLGAVAVLLAPAKTIYAALSLLVFIIPEKRFKSRKQWLLWGGGITALCLAAALAITAWTRSSPYPPADPESMRDLILLSELLQAPLGTAKMYFATLYVNWDKWIETFAGLQLSGLSLYTHNGYIYAYLFLLALTVLTEKKDLSKTAVSLSRRVWGLCVCAGICFLAVTSMLLGWTERGAIIIEGVQGRYFIPAALPALAMLSGRVLVSRRNVAPLLVPAALGINLLVLFDIFQKTLRA